MAKAKVLIEIHQNTKLKGDQFHVVYNGGNSEDTSSSEKFGTIASCKKNIKSHAYMFVAKKRLKEADLMEGAAIIKFAVDVNVYKDKVLQKTITVNF